MTELVDKNESVFFIAEEKRELPKFWVCEGKIDAIQNILRERVLPFYDIYDVFSAIVWCKNRGVEKYQTFLQENILTLRNSVGY
ncbi:DUF6756 family protein [Paenibacillus piri]|uniref:DUF6756 family protein n=1 Tax=Paenibacillus piri TaxID=2547395 RepID=UPI00319E53C3